MLACGPSCGCRPPPMVARPTQLGGFGFVNELVALAQVAATADSIASGHKKKKAPPLPPPPPPSILDSFGYQNRPLVMAGLGALGVLAVVRLSRGMGK